MVENELMSMQNEERAKHHQKYFKTGKGEYGEGDVFLGLSVPQSRSIAKKHYKQIDLEKIQKLLENKHHEMRFVALACLVLKFEEENKQEIFNFYLKNVKYINNWDLVDCSAMDIVGRFVYENSDYSTIDKLANSGHLWSERIAIVSTYYLIKKGEFSKIKELAVKFLEHKHDLIHKAIGWMLREMGKMNEAELRTFLDIYSKKLPRTALRYSIERLSPELRVYYMKKD